MKATYKCPTKKKKAKSNVYREIINKKSYNEHAAMHYDCDGWSHWTEVRYEVKKCSVCGGHHYLCEYEIKKIKM